MKSTFQFPPFLCLLWPFFVSFLDCLYCLFVVTCVISYFNHFEVFNILLAMKRCTASVKRICINALNSRCIEPLKAEAKGTLYSDHSYENIVWRLVLSDQAACVCLTACLHAGCELSVFSLKSRHSQRGMSSCLSQRHPGLLRPSHARLPVKERGRVARQQDGSAQPPTDTRVSIRQRGRLDLLLIQLLGFVFPDHRRTPCLSSGPDSVIYQPASLWRPKHRSAATRRAIKNQLILIRDECQTTDDRRHIYFSPGGRKLKQR